MRDDDERCAACIGIRQDGCDEACAAGGIEPCRRLIEEQDRRIARECKCGEQAAALSPRKTGGVHSERLVEPCGQRPHNVRELRRFECVPYCRLRDIAAQAQKVVPYGGREEPAALQGSTKIGARHVGGELRMGNAVVGDRARIRFPEAEQKACQCRLACAALTDDGRVLAAADRKAEVLHNGDVRMIAEDEVFHLDQRCVC